MKLKYIGNLQEFILDNQLDKFDNGAILIVEKCNIIYQYIDKKGQQEEISSVAKLQISTDTFQYGDIEIIGDDFDSFKIHTGFTPRLNEYTYDKDNYALIIKGESFNRNLINGKYHVTILT